MTGDYGFTFGGTASQVHILQSPPSLDRIAGDAGHAPSRFILVCDPHTEYIARALAGGRGPSPLVLPPGEAAKCWLSVESILAAALRAGLGRDGLFIGVGGGVISDITAFAASVYMRGARLCLVSTTLLGMVDAAVGGKTGFDLFGVKNLAGTFYPAEQVYMPMETLKTLPPAEWKSGMAELIKTAVLDGGEMLTLLAAVERRFPHESPQTAELISRAVSIKGRIVEEDPRETGTKRALLNLGHTFGHALESAAGLGTLSHGEAVAWGMARACELGAALGLTPRERAREIIALLRSFGYETAAPHPMMGVDAFFRALEGDKKKRRGKPVFVVPAARGAVLVPGDSIRKTLLEGIVQGAYGGD